MKAVVTSRTFAPVEKASMNEGIFWEVVADLGWGETTDVDALKRKLMDRFTYKAAMELQFVLSEKEAALYEAVEDYEADSGESCGLGDDGFNDLISHIVGLGREEYERVLANPKLAVKRAHDYAFEESFAYCWPSEFDYEGREFSGYYARIYGLLEEFASLQENPKVEASSVSEFEEKLGSLQKDIATVLDALNLLRTGEVPAFMATEEDVKACMQRLRKTQDLDWGVDNLYNDFRALLADCTVKAKPIPNINDWPERQRKQYEEARESD